MMKGLMLLILFLLMFSVLGLVTMIERSARGGSIDGSDAMSVFDITVNTIDGEPRPLSSYKGNVLLLVNTASKCGYTPQYSSLEKLYQTYRELGLRVLAFPANNFLWQEPGTNEEIKKFCTQEYHITFDLFAKISVRGRDKHPLYRYLTERSPFPGEVKWNFQKYLVDRDGTVVARFDPAVDPMSTEVRSRVEELLVARDQ